MCGHQRKIDGTDWDELASQCINSIKPPRPVPNTTWLSNIFSALGLITSVERLYSDVYKKTIILIGFDDLADPILRRYISLDREKQDIGTAIPRIGLPINQVRYPNEVDFFTLSVGGCRKWITFENAFVRRGDAIIMVLDANDRDTFLEFAEELARMTRYDEPNGKRMKIRSGVPILILVTNQKTLRAMSLDEIEKRLDRYKFTDGRPWAIKGARSDKDVYEALKWVAVQLQHNATPEMVETKTPIVFDIKEKV